MNSPRRPDSAFPAPRRVFTAPTYATPSLEQTPSSAGDGLVETLYNHPFAKIVSFTAGPRPVFSQGKGIAPPVEVQPGSLPWSSQLERTIAVGPFRIYRAPGSVAFLSCGSALQPILPKSQCWCVDEASSKYVLQIRRPQYWRIEVPVGDQDDVRRALELREVLDKVLQFEKTECPFKRTFTVELPEPPQTPVKKRPWTPVRRSSAALPLTPLTLGDLTPSPRAGDETIESPVTETDPELLEEVVQISDSKQADATSVVLPTVSEESRTSDGAVAGTVDAAVSALEQIAQERKDEEVTNEFLRLAQPSGFQANRSVTAPPQLSLVTPTTSNAVSAKEAAVPTAAPEAATEPSRSESPTGSHDSFHSVESFTSAVTPLPPSPPLTAAGSPKLSQYPQSYLFVSKKAHAQDSSDHSTITPNTPLLPQSEESTGPRRDEPIPQDTSFQGGEVPSTSQAPTAEDPLAPPSSTAPPSPPSTSAQPDPPTDAAAESVVPAVIARATSTSTSSTVLTRRSYIRHRPTTSSSISPTRSAALPRLPSTADLFPSYRSPSASTTTTTSTSTTPVPSSSQPTRPHQQTRQPSRLSLVRRLPLAVIHKTVSLLFSPPSHLVALMLQVAARIAAGQWRGSLSGLGAGGERIPVRWGDWSDGDDDGEGELGGWGADEDYWEFGAARTRRRGSEHGGLRMAGAFPESPEAEDGDGRSRPWETGGEEDAAEGEGPPPSPSVEREMRVREKDADRMGREEEEGGNGNDDDDDAAADWTGRLSVD